MRSYQNDQCSHQTGPTVLDGQVTRSSHRHLASLNLFGLKFTFEGWGCFRMVLVGLWVRWVKKVIACFLSDNGSELSIHNNFIFNKKVEAKY